MVVVVGYWAWVLDLWSVFALGCVGGCAVFDMPDDVGFEEATINPLTTFRRKWPVAGMPDAPQIVVWQFRTASRPLAKFEVVFHPAQVRDFEEGGGNDSSDRSRSRSNSLSWPGSVGKPSTPSMKVTGTPITVHSKTNIGCHEHTGQVISHFACHGHGYIELAWTNGFSLGQRHLSYRVSFARTDPLALAEPGDPELCNLATQARRCKVTA